MLTYAQQHQLDSEQKRNLELFQCEMIVDAPVDELDADVQNRNKIIQMTANGEEFRGAISSSNRKSSAAHGATRWASAIMNMNNTASMNANVTNLNLSPGSNNNNNHTLNNNNPKVINNNTASVVVVGTDMVATGKVSPCQDQEVEEVVGDQPDPDYIKMFVGQVPRTMDEQQLKEMFEEFGRVHQINVLRDKTSGQSKGCCFVTFYTRKAALKAQDALHNIKTLVGCFFKHLCCPGSDSTNSDEKEKEWSEGDMSDYFSVTIVARGGGGETTDDLPLETVQLISALDVLDQRLRTPTYVLPLASNGAHKA
uniref:RRM domain-containing protein n=1 Tax=Anopheles farauti TaxID=69004 RepID=A0A182QVD1_9DIPT